MILIISNHEDPSTSDIIEWLIYHYKYDKEILRLSSDDPVEVVDLSFKDEGIYFTFKHRDTVYNYKDIEAIWQRRGRLALNNNFHADQNYLGTSRTSQLPDFLSYLKFNARELQFFIETLIEENCFRFRRSIGSITSNRVKKLDQLFLAQKVGLNIPGTQVTSSRDVLQQFYTNEKELITKGIGFKPGFHIDDHYYAITTQEVDKEDIDNAADYFFPSIFQAKIDKAYELRIFYLHKKCYPMAIFSQSNPQTSLDFRRYSSDKPNRFVPYKLPHEIEKKIIDFMELINMDCGSLDILVDKKGNYIFLEVNNSGHFAMTSYPCNYGIEKKMAKVLAGITNS